MTVGFWFRRDLRVTDNPALLRAAADGEVLPFFIRDRSVRMATFRRRRFEAALRRLDEQIRAHGGAGLWIMEGEFTAVLALLQAQGVSSVFATGEYTPRGRRRDVRAHVAARAAGMDLEFHDSPYLHVPGEVRKPDGSRYQVFTPYYRAWLTLPKPEPESGVVAWWHDRELPQPVDPGLPDAGPMVLLSTLLDERLARYSDCRDRLDLDCTSHLSEPLHFGELHPRTVWQAAAGQPGSRVFCGSSPGGNSSPTPWAHAIRHGRAPELTSRTWPMTGTRTSKPGGKDVPAIRWWTRGCVSCSRPAGCTTGSG